MEISSSQCKLHRSSNRETEILILYGGVAECMRVLIFKGLRVVVCSLMFAMVRSCYTECYTAVRGSMDGLVALPSTIGAVLAFARRDR